MQKKVGIVGNDIDFINRFKETMNNRYEDLEIFVFPNVKAAQTAAKKSFLNLLLLDRSTIVDFDLSTPKQCKVAILTNEKNGDENGPLPTVCKYQSLEDWYNFICLFCKCEVERDINRGGFSNSQKQRGKVCLFIPGEGSLGVTAANEFCRFLGNRGISSATLSPYHGSGESIWETTEQISYMCEYVALYMNEWDKNNIVIPILNADLVVLVSNGQQKANNTIEKLINELPKSTGESKDYIKGKVSILYEGFNPKTGKLIKSDAVGRVGGIDNERNTTAAFEKMVIYLNV